MIFIGILIGAPIGYGIAALMFIAKREDKRMGIK